MEDKQRQSKRHVYKNLQLIMQRNHARTRNFDQLGDTIKTKYTAWLVVVSFKEAVGLVWLSTNNGDCIICDGFESCGPRVTTTIHSRYVPDRCCLLIDKRLIFLRGSSCQSFCLSFGK